MRCLASQVQTRPKPCEYTNCWTQTLTTAGSFSPRGTKKQGIHIAKVTFHHSSCASKVSHKWKGQWRPLATPSVELAFRFVHHIELEQTGIHVVISLRTPSCVCRSLCGWSRNVHAQTSVLEDQMLLQWTPVLIAGNVVQLSLYSRCEGRPRGRRVELGTAGKLPGSIVVGSCPVKAVLLRSRELENGTRAHALKFKIGGSFEIWRRHDRCWDWRRCRGSRRRVSRWWCRVTLTWGAPFVFFWRCSVVLGVRQACMACLCTEPANDVEIRTKVYKLCENFVRLPGDYGPFFLGVDFSLADVLLLVSTEVSCKHSCVVFVRRRLASAACVKN